MLIDRTLKITADNRKEYEDAVFQQLDAWVQGTSLHNTVNGECCPDFSCCYADMKMPLEKRRDQFMKYMVEKGIIQ